MQIEDTVFCKKMELRNHNKSLNFSSPLVMGILNLSPDSFFDGGRYNSEKVLFEQVEKMMREGVDILDVGAQSSRPGAKIISEEEESNRLLPFFSVLRKEFPDLILSVDTFRAEIVKKIADQGADIINDIAAGEMDKKMFSTILELNIPYIMMHMQGTPSDMQIKPEYQEVVTEVFNFLETKVDYLKKQKFNNIIIDPGFGFGKSLAHNYSLLKNLNQFKKMNFPILVGLSRKSMIQKVLNVKAEEALNGTSMLNTVALLNGANILRVHDVKEAKECIRLYQQLKS